MSVNSKSRNAAIFSDTINMTNVKLCMMVVVTQLDCISKSQQCQTVFSDSVEILYDC